MRKFVILFSIMGLLLGSCLGDDLIDPIEIGAISTGGGQVYSTFGATLIVPASSLDNPLIIKLEKGKLDSPLPKLTLISPVVKVLPANLEFGKGLPARLLLPISMSTLAQDRSIWEIQAYMLSDKKWTKHRAAIDDSQNIAILYIEKSATFALFLSTIPPKKEKTTPRERISESTVEKTTDAGNPEATIEKTIDAGNPEASVDKVIVESSAEKVSSQG